MSSSLPFAHPPWNFCGRVGGKKTNLTTPLRPLSSAPVLFSSCRASPISYLFFGYSLHRRSPTSHRSTVSRRYLTSRSDFLTIIRNLHRFYDTPYPKSCTLHLETPRFLVLLQFYLSTRYPQTPGCPNDNLPHQVRGTLLYLVKFCINPNVTFAVAEG